MLLAEEDIKISTTDTTDSVSMDMKILINTDPYDVLKFINILGEGCILGQGKEAVIEQQLKEEIK